MTNPQKAPITSDEIERRLTNDPQPQPPIELLDKIRQEIPEDLDVTGSGRRMRPQTWLLAATLATVVLGGFLAYRLGEMNRWSVEAAQPDGPRATTETSERLRADAQESESDVAPTPVGTSAESQQEDDRDSEARADASAAEVRLENELVSVPAEEPAAATQPEVAERMAALGYTAQTRGKKIPIPRTQAEEQVRQSVDALSSGTAVAPEPMRFRSTAGSPAPPSTGGTHEPNDRPYGDMFFKNYGTNPFLDPEEDALSTFGLDVDTGSYSLTRSYLERGNLPPAEAIRVEEFLNSFDYGDAAPQNWDRERGDFRLSAEGAPAPFAEHENYVLLRFGIQGRQIADRDRPPSTLIFVVDVSGSMQRENRLGLVQRSLGLLLDQLKEDDRVGLVVYGSRGEVLLEPSRDHDRIRRAIERLRAGGSTNAEEGLVLAYDLAREFYRDGDNHRVILCSDGVANVGRTGPESILARIGREADAGIEMTTVGFGMGNYNDVLMEQLADQGDGRYAYVDDLKEARRLFVEELTGTLQTIAADAKAQVEFNPEVVERYRLIGYENRDIADERFRDDSVDAGEIGAGHHVTALYEVKLRDDVPGRREIATLRLRYHSKRAGEVIEEELAVRHRDLDNSMGDASDSLKLAALVAEFGEILKGSYWAKDADLERVLRGARDVARATRDPKVAEFRDLVATAVRLSASTEPDPDWIGE